MENLKEFENLLYKIDLYAEDYSALITNKVTNNYCSIDLECIHWLTANVPSQA